MTLQEDNEGTMFGDCQTCTLVPEALAAHLPLRADGRPALGSRDPQDLPHLPGEGRGSRPRGACARARSPRAPPRAPCRRRACAEATEPSGVRTARTSSPISVEKALQLGERQRREVLAGLLPPRAPRAPPLRGRRGTARPCAPGSRRGRWRSRSLRRSASRMRSGTRLRCPSAARRGAPARRAACRRCRRAAPCPPGCPCCRRAAAPLITVSSATSEPKTRPGLAAHQLGHVRDSSSAA